MIVHVIIFGAYLQVIYIQNVIRKLSNWLHDGSTAVSTEVSH